MEELKVLKSSALVAYNEADETGKKLLVNLLGKKHFLVNAMDRIKTFEDACEEQGEDPLDEKFRTGTPDEIAYKRLKVIVRALCGDWVPDWNNGNQRKWAPWFYMNSPGFRFYGTYYGITNAGTTGGSRLCYPSEEIAAYAGKQFLEIYKQWLS